MLKQKKCPKCEGEVVIKSNGGGYGLCHAECLSCDCRGESALIESFALACFFRQYGESLVNLTEINDAGGPPPRTMVWRIRHRFYLDAQMRNRKWRLPFSTAQRVVEEWKQRQGMIPLPEVALACGLKSTSLNLAANQGIVHGRKFDGRWFVTVEESERLQRYYRDTVTSSRAAEILGLKHRASLLKLVRDGRVSCLQISVERRFGREELQRLLFLQTS